MWEDRIKVWVPPRWEQPGIDKPVQVALVRFEAGKPVATASSLLQPGIPIPAEATGIHGVTDEMVKGAPTVEEWFSGAEPKALLEGANLKGCLYDHLTRWPAGFRAEE